MIVARLEKAFADFWRKDVEEQAESLPARVSGPTPCPLAPPAPPNRYERRRAYKLYRMSLAEGRAMRRKSYKAAPALPPHFGRAKHV